uniref:Uncharacterized protein n=1 Tax=Oryza glumipatula TaxID=40148 RepID=A0A0E0AGD0_9ORYZ
MGCMISSLGRGTTDHQSGGQRSTGQVGPVQGSVTAVDYIALPHGTNNSNCVISMPSGMAADWEVFSRDGGSYTRHTVPMDLESLSLRPRPGRGFSIGGAYGPAYRAGQLHGAHHHNLPIFITASSEKSILEKVWEANQFIFGMFLLGSYQYVTNVQSMHGSDKLKDALLIAFSILWCLLGIGFHLHFYSRNSEIRQKICSFILTAFTVMFSVLVTIHISMLLHSKKIAEAGRIIKLVFVVSVHVAIKIWFECNLGERISGWWSGCPVLPLSSAPGDVTRDNAYRLSL